MVSLQRLLLYFIIVVIIESISKPFLLWIYSLLENAYFISYLIKILCVYFKYENNYKYIIIKLLIVEGLVEYIKSYICNYYEITFIYILKRDYSYLSTVKAFLETELTIFDRVKFLTIFLTIYLIIYHINLIIKTALKELTAKIFFFFYYYLKEAFIIIFSPISLIITPLFTILSPVTDPILSAFAGIFSVFSSIFSFFYYYTTEAFDFLFKTFIWYPITTIAFNIVVFLYNLSFLLENTFIPILTYIILSDPLLALQYISLVFEFIIMIFNRFTHHGYYKFFGYGKCIECGLLFKDKDLWCKPCNSKRFQDDFSQWDSGNETINNIIRNTQINAGKACQVIEWIPYNHFINIEYIASGGFSKVYRANWLHGPILSWDRDRHYIRNDNMFVALKELKKSSNISDDFLKEVNNKGQ